MRSRDSADMLAEDEDALRQAAWRWRFNRRWAQEQARGMDPDYGRQVSFALPASAKCPACGGILLKDTCAAQPHLPACSCCPALCGFRASWEGYVLSY